ncbi:cytokine-dependent hematopoietic cell linker, partial [Mugil cephalus]|uniref:cytokine-dependent hematopoietic cell linker n=1 Tax=Mugil cephalus TaxID=48193 RepID=UPI001FB68C68
ILPVSVKANLNTNQRGRHFWTPTDTGVITAEDFRKAAERGNSHESAVIMDRSRAERNRTQRCGSYNDVNEHEYDVVDDQQEGLGVCILPARPIDDEREYADRDLPRSSSAQSLSSLSSVNIPVLPRYPPRETPHISRIIKGPAVNRDLKPGRQRTRLDKRLIPVHLEDQNSHRGSPSPPPPPFTSRLVNDLSAPTAHEPPRRSAPQKVTNNGDSISQSRGSHSADRVSSLQTNQRHSLDLETHTLERSHQNIERVPSKRHHHEWPQTKEDIDQNDFVPMGKPQQTYSEEDWYIGPCNRADAEHALHLVNKDGAFLVRDCSLSNNSEPLVLVVYHEKKVYNVKIRFIESTCKFALGTAQRSNDMFDTVADIIKFHSIFPITVISGRSLPGNKHPENCVLTCPVTKRDVEMLLR